MSCKEQSPIIMTAPGPWGRGRRPEAGRGGVYRCALLGWRQGRGAASPSPSAPPRVAISIGKPCPAMFDQMECDFGSGRRRGLKRDIPRPSPYRFPSGLRPPSPAGKSPLAPPVLLLRSARSIALRSRQSFPAPPPDTRNTLFPPTRVFSYEDYHAE